MRELANLSEDDKILVFEEVRPSMIEPIELETTLKQAELQHGDILTFQKPAPNKYVKESLKSYLFSVKCEYPLIPDYYKYLLMRINVKFYHFTEPKELSFTVELLKNYSYKQVTSKISGKLNVKPQFIRIWGHNP